jgi:hypothetical protein
MRMAQMPIPSAPERLPPTKDFLALSKDADPDIPILKEPKRSMRSCNNR